MTDYDDFDERGGLESSRWVETCLAIGGWVIVTISVFWGFAAFVGISRTGEATGVAVLAILAKMIGGVWGGVALIGLNIVIRRLAAIQHADEQTASRRSDAQANRPRAAVGGVRTGDASEFDEVVVLMRELRDISLLNDEQRTLRLQAQGKAVLSLLQREVPVLLREHNWIEARERVQEARERFPTCSDWDEMERQIEEMRARVEARDIEAAKRQIDDLASLGAWERVAEVVNELLERHPDAPQAIELAQGLRAQRHRAEAEHRTKLMAMAQDAANQREWKTALATATSLIQQFPKSPEAQSLRIQLPTLQENLEIQLRQGMENDIRELIKAQRFDEAFRAANELIQQYPASPQAAALREQLPRLEEKAAAAAGGRY